MSFHLSAEEESIEIRDNHKLYAKLKDVNGDWQESEIDLNQVLGNNDGHFEWDGENFSLSAQNVTFSIEGGGEVPVLRAELADREGNYQSADVNLAERIENQNGQFVFV